MIRQCCSRIYNHYRQIFHGENTSAWEFQLYFILGPILFFVLGNMLYLNIIYSRKIEEFDYQNIHPPASPDIISPFIWGYLLILSILVIVSQNEPWKRSLGRLIFYGAFIFILVVFFTPKITTGCGNANKLKSVSMEAFSTVAGAFQEHRKAGNLTAQTKIRDLFPYLNYVEEGSRFEIDSVFGQPTIDCSKSKLSCISMHNGSVIVFDPQESFGALDDHHAIRLVVDPDGHTTGPDGPYRGVAFYLYSDGRILSDAGVRPGTRSSLAQYEPNPDLVPNWLNVRD